MRRQRHHIGGPTWNHLIFFSLSLLSFFSSSLSTEQELFSVPTKDNNRDHVYNSVCVLTFMCINKKTVAYPEHIDYCILFSVRQVGSFSIFSTLFFVHQGTVIVLVLLYPIYSSVGLPLVERHTTCLSPFYGTFFVSAQFDISLQMLPLFILYIVIFKCSVYVPYL